MNPVSTSTVAAGPAHQLSLRRLSPKRAIGRCMLLFAIRFLWGAPYRLRPGARKACPLPSAFEPHHVLHDRLALLRHFGLLARSVRAVIAQLFRLAGHLYGDHRFDLIPTLVPRCHWE